MWKSVHQNSSGVFLAPGNTADMCWHKHALQQISKAHVYMPNACSRALFLDDCT